MLDRHTAPAVGALQLLQLSAGRRARRPGTRCIGFLKTPLATAPWFIGQWMGHCSAIRSRAQPGSPGARVNVPTSQSPSADYLALLSTFPGMVFRRQNDEAATLTFVSEGSRELLGIAPEELTSGRRSYLSLIHPEDRPAFFAYFNATLSGSPTAHAQYRLVLDDGTIKWIWGNTHAVKAADGRIESIHGYIIDITEQRISALRDQHRITILAALASRAPLKTVMDAIVHSMEAEDPSIAC